MSGADLQEEVSGGALPSGDPLRVTAVDVECACCSDRVRLVVLTVPEFWALSMDGEETTVSIPIEDVAAVAERLVQAGRRLQAHVIGCEGVS
jgi:ketopantoate hydroxymethyltransferase